MGGSYAYQMTDYFQTAKIRGCEPSWGLVKVSGFCKIAAQSLNCRLIMLKLQETLPINCRGTGAICEELGPGLHQDEGGTGLNIATIAKLVSRLFFSMFIDFYLV